MSDHEHLPKGPYEYRPWKHDDWGIVRDRNGNVIANTCPAWLASEHGYRTDLAGPPQAAAVAQLLIDAREVIDQSRELYKQLRELAAEFRVADDEWAAVRLETVIAGKDRR